MHKNKQFLILAFLVLLLASCQPAEEISFSHVCHVTNNHKTMRVDGYFSLGASVYCSDISGELRCGLNFNQYPDGGLDFSAEVKEGRRRNMMVPLERGYLDEDLQIKTAEGNIIKAGDHVMISGKLLVTEDVCLMYVNKIESIDQ